MRPCIVFPPIASEYQVHATQIHLWKKQFTTEGPAIFQKAKDQEKAELKDLVDELYKQIGQLKVERDWIKKNLKCSPREKTLLLETDLLMMREIDKIFTERPICYGRIHAVVFFGILK